MDAIDTLPLVDTPEVFGLHMNADITYQTNSATTILDTILNIQPKDSGGGSGETREAVVFRQAQEMLDKLPPDYVQHEVGNLIVICFVLSLLSIFILQTCSLDSARDVERRTTCPDLLGSFHCTVDILIFW